MSDQHKNFESINIPCEAKVTYNFTLGSTAPVGHLLSLSFTNSGKDLVADTPVPNPESPDEKINIIGAFDFIQWEGGPTEPIQADFRISPQNKAILQEALSSLTGGAELEAQWAIYNYDYKEKKYFMTFHTDGNKIKFVVTKGTKVLIAPEADRQVQQPLNFCVSMSITAKSEGDDQEVNIAYTSANKFTRRIGVNAVA